MSALEFWDVPYNIHSAVLEFSPRVSLNSIDFRKLSSVLIALLIASLVLWFLKLCSKQAMYLRMNPGQRQRFFDIKGAVKMLPLSERARNGQSFFVLVFQIMSAYSELYRKEKLCMLWTFFTPSVVLLKPDVIEEVLMKIKLTDKAWLYTWLEPWLSKGLFTSNGSKWRKRRKMLTPCFHFDILKDFMGCMCEHSQELVHLLKKEITKDFTSIYKPIQLCTLDIVCETSFGVQINALSDENSEICHSIGKIMDLLIHRFLNPLNWSLYIYSFSKNGRELQRCIDYVHNFTRKVIREKKQKLLNGETDATKQKRKALMDFLLDQHMSDKNFTEEDISEEVNTFTVEGHDTTSTTITWVLYLIGLHKNVQDRIVEELDRIFGDDRQRHPNTEDIKDMTYLDCVLKETMRLYPVLPYVGKAALEETVIGGYRFPKGTIIAFNIYDLHRDPESFPNPEKFDPDRFLTENSSQRHPFAYIPFLAGYRNCIGQKFAMMEMKIMVSFILRNFTLKSLDPRDKVLPSFELVTRPSIPVRIRIRSRQRSSLNLLQNNHIHMFNSNVTLLQDKVS